MKKLAILVAALFATAAIAQDKAAPKAPATKAPEAKAAAPKAEPAKAPEVKVVGETAKVTATVEAIDQKTREVTLKGPKGNKLSFVAGPEVKNLAQVQKGDEVVIEYVQALAMELKKSAKTAVSRTITEGAQTAAAGQKPGVVAARKIAFVAKVDAIDTKTNVVTLSGVEHTVDLKVKDPAVLKNFKAGDFVEGAYVEAMAVSVQKPAAKPAAAAPAAPAAPAKK
jgi:Cu/Ag efflux protein CusF